MKPPFQPRLRIWISLALGWLALWFCGAMRADDPTLVRVGEYWRYWKGVAAPATNAWRLLGFDDSNWITGRSGFGYTDGATQLMDFSAGNYTSLFLRKRFTVTDPAQVQWLVLRADYQDGLVAYLNGVEIARRGFAPDVEVPFNERASVSHPAGAAEEVDVSAFKSLLQPGDNLLAIQIHSAGAAPLGFYLCPELLANFTRGPFLQAANTHQVKIIWRTPIASDSKIEYGVEPGLKQVWSAPALTNTHVATLTGLAPETLYYYRISSSADGRTAVSPRYRFRTFRPQGGLSFMAVGDTGLGKEAQYRIAQVIQDSAADLVIHLGDVVYPKFTLGRADLKCFSVYQPDMARRPWFFLYGNHDRYDNTNDFPASFYSPTNPVTGGGQFYSFDQGVAHFVALDTDLGAGADWREDSPQYRWLAADLAASTQPWKFLLFHNAMRSSGPHRFDDYNSNGVRDEYEFQNTIGALAERYGVQVLFNAHEHLYERLNPRGGVHTIVSGGGGGVLYSFGGEWDPADSQLFSQHHCLRVMVERDFLELQALDTDGNVFDTLHLGREPSAHLPSHSTWHTPVLAFTGTNDGLGNLDGQQFDFAGTPIHTVAGDFSNLGNLYVNHDSNTLFIGFSQAMIYASNNVFLFIQSPRLAGVSNLAGLGNGMLDPLGQGADGLDFLKNLSFTNFTPGIGALLGDEYGDGQYRSFNRPALPIDIGQGIYYLDATFTDVPGARLQQFNRSPQRSPVTHEQNADFIALAIPFSSLGGMQLGDHIRIGAVVGGSLMDTNPASQYRQLDRSFAGLAWHQTGLYAAQLEGFELALDPPHETPGDSDGDGAPDAEECQAGTDPFDPQSIFKVTVERDAYPGFCARWSAVPGNQYVLEHAEGQARGFQTVAPVDEPLTATSSSECLRVELAPNTRAPQFYRVRLMK
jgi:hypothetical protein